MDKILEGIALVFTFEAFLMMVLGSVIGVVMGAIPGLTGTMAIALVLPITLYVSPWVGIPLILSIYKAATWAGSVGSILINAPGNAAAAAMTVDGYALKKQGKGLKALKATLISGVVGDVFSDIVTILVCMPLAAVALMFGSPEFMLLIVAAFVVISSVGQNSAVKSIISAGLGIVVSMVGLDPVIAAPRLTFGMYQLMDGVKLVPMMIGTFALSEMIQKLMTREEDIRPVHADVREARDSVAGNNRYSRREFMGHLPVILRSAVIGTWIGILPGIGSSVSPWIAYTAAKKTSKHPEEYGKGSVEGLVACQSAANAVCGANLVPLLTLGIPGDTVAAMLIGTLMVHGLSPGPLIFQRSPEAVYAIFATLLFCDFIYLVVGWITCNTAGRITSVKNSIMIPFIVVLCVLGTYAYNNSMFDVYVMLFFGIVGYFMRLTGMNVAIFVIAFILGPMLERNFRQSMILFDGNILGIFSRPVTVVISVVLAAVVLNGLVKSLTGRARARGKEK
jgi:putative tricarboxylic transport membrane protein